MNSGQNEPMLRIEKEFISALPLLQYEGKIVLVESEAAAKKAVKELSREKILGFDTETRPNFRKGAGYMVSLVQLCGGKCAYLFRLDYCGGVPVLFPLFENPNILKVGVAVKDDVHHLKIRAPFDDAGFVDASRYTRAARIENTGLRALTAHFLGGRISKAAQVSNWAARELSPQQIVYAATDAWTSRELFLKLQRLGIAPQLKSAGPIDGNEPSDEAPAGRTEAVPADGNAESKKKRRRFRGGRGENAPRGDAARKDGGKKNASDGSAPRRRSRRRGSGKKTSA